MPNEKIADRQLWFILFIMRSIIIISFLPLLTSADALQDAWISGIIVLAGSEVFVILFTLLDIRFPDSTIIEYSQQLTGKWLGRLLGLGLLWLFLQLSLVEIRIYGEMLTTGFLVQTPLLVIIGGMVFTSVVCVYSGIEVLGRCADIIFFLFVIMFLGVVITPLNEMNINNLQPILVRGWGPVLRGALVPIALISQVWVLGMLSDNTVNPGKNFWIPVTAIGTSLILLIVIVIIVVASIGAYEGTRSTFPILTLMRSTELSNFLQRTEALVIFGWGLGLFISVSTFLYSGARGLAQWLNLADYRPLLLPMGVIWTGMSIFSFDGVFDLNKFMSPEIFVPYGFFFLLIPLGLLWTAYGIKKATDNLERKEK